MKAKPLDLPDFGSVTSFASVTVPEKTVFPDREVEK